jgi:DNA primase catalytic core
MIKNEQDIKSAAGVLDIVKEYVDLKPRGTSFLGLCPFHNEKTPSFNVSPGKGIYKCFGCGASGDGIQFLMDHKGMSYPEALEEAARIARVPVEYDDSDEWRAFREKNKEQNDRNKSLKNLLLQLHSWMYQNSWAHVSLGHCDQVDFAGRHYTWSTIKEFGLCYVEKGNLITATHTQQGWPIDDLLHMGLVRHSNEGGALYDYFRERYLFPISDHLGNIIAFGGRKPKEDKNKRNPKYLNSPESSVYDKSTVLFGLSNNIKHIKRQGYAALVEGYTDVISLYEYEVKNAVATCGTALTEQQAKLLKRFTDQVLLLRDGDEAGRKAAERDVEVCLKAGLMVKVALLPEGEDPDSFIRTHTKAGYELFLEEESEDGLLWRSMQLWDKNDIFKQEKAFDVAASLISYIKSATLRENYIRELTKKGNMGSVRKQLNDKVTSYDEKRLVKQTDLSEAQERSIIEFGLYEKNNRYWLTNDVMNDGFTISNFIVKPIMLIIGANASQRLVEIRNDKSKSYIINCDSSVFTSLSKFKEATERFGAFVFNGKPEHYERVKMKVYRESKDCFPISVMGMHREGFYTWGNGISVDGKFKEVDEYGVVTYNKTRYFLPAFSRLQENIKADDMDTMFEFEKKFTFFPELDCITFDEWSLRMKQVHGWNGAMAVAFACASLFRDIVFQKFQFFPHLNAFGPSGSGKTFLARSIMALFGKSNKHDPFNLASGTAVAFKRRLAQVSNGVIWFDEYSNDIFFGRVEALKGAYDGAGHEKGVASQDNRTITTKVKSAIMITGQQQMTKDIALYKRAISLNCKSGRNTIERQKRAKELKAMEETGQFTQITQYLLQYRSLIEEHFSSSFESGRALINIRLEKEGRVVEDRIVNNHLIPLAVMDVLSGEIELGFDYKEFFEYVYQNIIEQSESIFNEDELSIFWRIVEYLHQKGLADPRSGIHHNIDIVVQEKTDERYQNELNKKEKKDSIQKSYPEKAILVYIRFATLHPEYQERHSKQRGKNGLDLGALQYYLRTSSAYEGQKRAKKFGDKSYSCYVFNLAELPVELPLTIEVKPTDEEDEDKPF